MRRNIYGDLLLPLLGSNQDSSDPESEGLLPLEEFLAAERVRIAQNRSRITTEAPTIPHTTEEDPRERRRVSPRKTRLKAFGLTIEQYDAMLEAQGGVCAICRKECAAKRRLSVDHCHATGVNRGLLCRACNAGLGSFRDDPEALVRASVYLQAARRIVALATAGNRKLGPVPPLRLVRDLLGQQACEGAA